MWCLVKFWSSQSSIQEEPFHISRNSIDPQILHMLVQKYKLCKQILYLLFKFTDNYYSILVNVVCKTATAFFKIPFVLMMISKKETWLYLFWIIQLIIKVLSVGCVLFHVSRHQRLFFSSLFPCCAHPSANKITLG